MTGKLSAPSLAFLLCATGPCAAWTWGQPWPGSCGAFPATSVDLALNADGMVLWNDQPATGAQVEIYLRRASRTDASRQGHVVFAYAGQRADEEKRLASLLRRHGFAFQPECRIPPMPGLHIDPRTR